MARLLALFLLLATPAFAVSNPAELLPDPAQESRAEAIGHTLRCLVCQNESVEESDADLARDLRRHIRERVVAGDTDSQITAWMVARYGDFVRLNPPFSAVTLLLWGSPVLAVGIGIGIAAAALARRRRPAPPAPLSRDEQARLTELLRPQ
jgi:cytochrome c-type biogenesis protein CcmH